MHGREGEEWKRMLHMWPVPTPGTAAKEKQAVIPQLPAPPAGSVKTSLDSLLKDGRKIQVGDCALFQAGNSPPFIGIIRWFSTDKEVNLKLCVNWLYRPVDIKLSKGTVLEAAPNEVFYSFHKDIIPAASLLHPCKVAFLREGVELPLGISSFICRRVYDITHKCLWWLTDQDYINEHQEVVDQLLDKTQLEMHAAVQSGAPSPKRLSGPSSNQQLKSCSDSIQNGGTSFSSQVKGKKRDRGDQAVEPIKREQTSKVDDGDSTGKFDSNMIKSELSKIAEKGALISSDGVEKLVQLMQVDDSKKIDLTGRVLMADVISATDRIDCLNKFVQIRGVPVLDEWLQEAHKGKTGDGNSPKDSDKAVEELLLALLRALDKLPVNLHALQTCNVGKSVNHLRSHKNLEIQKKARSLVDTWKKRVDAEMKTTDAKHAGTSQQAVTWQAKPGFSEVSHAGNRRNGSGELSMKSTITQQSTCKGLSGKSVYTDSVKSTTVIVGSGKLQTSSFAPVGIISKDSLSKVAVNNVILELPHMLAKEERSSSSSQSPNNSQSCSSDHGKTLGSSLKEDARSSTAGSASKTSGGLSRNRRSSNGFVASNISVGQKESNSGRSCLLIQNSISEKVSQAGLYCERTVDVSALEPGSSHRLIVRLPNPGRSPARSTSGGSLDDPTAGSRASSPGVLDKHDHGDCKVIGRIDTCRTHIVADVNAESWQGNDVKEGFVGCDEGDRLSMIVPDEERRDETARVVETHKAMCLLSGNDKCTSVTEPEMMDSFSSMNALIESCAKYSEATTPLSGDDIGMNLLASVAAGETSKSNLVSPVSSPRGFLATDNTCSGTNEIKNRFSSGDSGTQYLSPPDENTGSGSLKHGKDNTSVFVKDEIQVVAANFPHDSKGTEEIGFFSDVKEEFDRGDENQNKDDGMIEGLVTEDFTDCKSVVSSIVDQMKTRSSSCEKIAEGSKFTSDSGCKSLFHGIDCEVSASGKDVEKTVIAESSLHRPFGKDVCVGAILLEQKRHPAAKAEMKVVERKGDDTPTLPIDNKLQCPENVDLLNCKKFDGSAQGGYASSSCGMTNGAQTIERNASFEKHDAGSDDHDQLPTVHSEADAYAKMSADDVERKDELDSSVEISSFVTTAEQDVGAKLDFDLNEGILGDDVIQSEPICTSTPDYSSTIRISSPSPLASSPITLNGSPCPVTVAAPAKGSFMSHEIFLKNKGKLGWKGSAATSAFRPAEPRKVVGMAFNYSDVHSLDTAIAKQGRPPLEFDLNVSDERALEGIASQNSVQTKRLKPGVISNHNVPPCSAGGLDLDLNRLDEGAENGQFLETTRCRFEVPLLHATVGFHNGEANMSRDFDLNSGPGIDDINAEPLPRNRYVMRSNNMPFASTSAGFRMNSTELGSGWFPPGHSYPTVAIPSFLHDRGEQPYPIVAAAGTQRMLGPLTGAGTFGSDMYRVTPSPAMAYSPSATAFSYTGFPFGTNFPLASASFSTGSTNYIDASSGGCSYFPPLPSPLVGATGAVSSPYTRSYMISHPEGSAATVSESSRKWGRQGLDLNAGPGCAEEVKDDRLPSSSSRQMHTGSSQSFMEEQARQFHVAGGAAALKRKEPDGGWDTERFGFKQPSWQ